MGHNIEYKLSSVIRVKSNTFVKVTEHIQCEACYFADSMEGTICTPCILGTLGVDTRYLECASHPDVQFMEIK